MTRRLGRCGEQSTRYRRMECAGERLVLDQRDVVLGGERGAIIYRLPLPDRWSIIKAAALGAEKGAKLSLTMDGNIQPMENQMHDRKL